MKTKELIRLLQKEDPSGEDEVVIGGLGNVDIHYVDRVPGYYDGDYEVLIRDPGRKPYFDVVGIRLTDKGSKVVIKTYELEDLIYDAVYDGENPAVEYDLQSKDRIKRAQERVEFIKAKAEADKQEYDKNSDEQG